MTSMLEREPLTLAAKRMFKPPEWEWAQTGAVGWWLRGPWRETLLGPDGLRLDQWREEGRLTTVKSGPHRVVYRVDLADGAIYIKHYLVPDFRAMFRQWIRRGKGRNEGKRSEVLASIGIPTIHPIALGECRKRNFLLENYLITWEIPGTIPLDEFLETELPNLDEPTRSLVRQRVAVSLGVLTARLHNAGLTHIDFHPGNILVRLDPDDRPELTMIDLDALRQSTQLSWSKAQKNLALLDHYFWLRSQPQRSSPIPRGLSPTPLPAGRRRAHIRPRDRTGDPGLGRTALEAMGPAVSIHQQVFPGVQVKNRLGRGLPRPRSQRGREPAVLIPTNRSLDREQYWSRTHEPRPSPRPQ